MAGTATLPISGGYRLWVQASIDRSDDALPLLWVLDGASLFASVARAVAMLSRRPDATGVQPMLVVGIDHDPADRTRRDADYSFGPCHDPAGAARPARYGGGPAMLDRIAGSMLTAVMTEYRVDAGRQALFGHSLAGLFAVHAFAGRPGLFRTAGAISPSIWWDRGGVHSAIGQMPDRGQRLFLGAGEREAPERVESDAERRRDARGIVRETQAAASVVAKRLSEARVELVIAPGEDHASAPLALLPRFLRFASAGFVR